MKNMTTGNIPQHLVSFSIPLILGNLFQLTYSAVDSIVVGQFAGTDSLAAIGTANPVMNIVILGITGICIGASVLMSEFFGANDKEKVKKTLATTLVFGSIFSLAIVIVGVLLSEPLLKLLAVPEEILDKAALYLRIIFFAMPFTYLYNAYSAAMRSVGDARTPIRFLAIASVLNGCLDMVFVAGLHMDVGGAGLATLIAEGVSGLLCVIYVHKKVPFLALSPKELKLDTSILRLTLKNGSVTALQQACQPIGKLLIQGIINPLGIESIAAFNAVSRVDDFAFTPEQSVSHGMMTFIAQNRGAGKKERMKKGLRDGLFVEFGYWVIICVVILVFKKSIMQLFVSEESLGMINIGISYLTLMAFFYILPAFTNGMQGFFRGMNDMKITLTGTVIQISLRVVFVYLLVPRMGLTAVAYASLIGWICMLLAEVPYYFLKKKSMGL